MADKSNVLPTTQLIVFMEWTLIFPPVALRAHYPRPVVDRGLDTVVPWAWGSDGAPEV